MKINHKLRNVAPTILTVLSVVGVVATAVLAVRATPKAIELLEKSKDEKGEALTKIEIIQVAATPYIPAIITCVATIGCIFGANILSKHNQSSLTSAYALLHQSYERYKKAATTVYGDDADVKIKAEMAKETYISADGYALYSSELDSDSERILCHDIYSNRYFTATMAAVLNAEYHLNRNLSLRGWASINEFYDFLGIEKLDIGDRVGWCYDQLMDIGILWLDFQNIRAVIDSNMECVAISALYNPILDGASYLEH
ncbi:hypothetical protein FACS1894132_04770 [Clostridia bacterium]|nr:hypothetical protein FACS1894132_04770 [Clostridia bacterium]